MSSALVIITNGEARGEHKNAALLRLTDQLNQNAALKKNNISAVTCAVLSGKPSVTEALRTADNSSASALIIYPLFLSEGYFFKTALPNQIKATKDISKTLSILPPLALDSALPALLYQKSLDALSQADWTLAETRLIIVGHGSTKNTASANATHHQADALKNISQFSSLQTAFLEEAPFIKDVLAQSPDQPTILTGYFTGRGLHGRNDMEDAIKATGANAIYACSIGSVPEISELIIKAAISFQNT